MARGRQPELAGMEMTLNMFKVYKSMATPVAADVMKRMAIRTLAISQTMVPVDTGSLKASGEVTKIDELTYQVSYGALHGKDASAFEGIDYRPPWYAIFVHEINIPHKVGGWKYLERAVLMVFQEAIDDNGPHFVKSMSGASYGATDTSGEYLPQSGWEQPWGHG